MNSRKVKIGKFKKLNNLIANGLHAGLKTFIPAQTTLGHKFVYIQFKILANISLYLMVILLHEAFQPLPLKSYILKYDLTISHPVVFSFHLENITWPLTALAIHTNVLWVNALLHSDTWVTRKQHDKLSSS